MKTYQVIMPESALEEKTFSSNYYSTAPAADSMYVNRWMGIEEALRRWTGGNDMEEYREQFRGTFKPLVLKDDDGNYQEYYDFDQVRNNPLMRGYYP